MTVEVKGIGQKESIEVIEGFGYNKKMRCYRLLKQMIKFHKVQGKRHLTIDKYVSDKTCSDRWYFIHFVCAELYEMGYQVRDIIGIKQKHCIALCRHWEALGFSSSTIATRKSMLRMVLSWVGRESTLDELQLNELFLNPSVITRPQKSNRNKSLSASLKEEGEALMKAIELDMPGFRLNDSETLWAGDPLSVLGQLWRTVVNISGKSKANRRCFITMLELMYWFGLRPREAAFFKPQKDIKFSKTNESYVFVVKQGSKGGRVRKVILLEEGQLTFLKELKGRVYCHDRVMPRDVKKTTSWMRAFNRFCQDNGLSAKNKKHPYSLRHEYAQRTYENISGQPSPVRLIGEYKVDTFAKQIVSNQLGHNRPSIAGAYIG